MKSYKALRAQIAKLEQQAKTVRHNEVKAVIAQLKKTIAEYGLTAEELGLAGGGNPGPRRGRKPAAAPRTSAGVAKYRDPKTGQTWTGRGRPPTWIVDAKNRDTFLIGAVPAAAPAPSAPAAPKRAKAAAKRGPGGKKAAAKKSRKTRSASKAPAVQIESGVAME